MSKYKIILLLILAGLMLGYTLVSLNSYLIWVSFIPLFVALKNQNLKNTIFYAIIFSSVVGFIGLFWVPYAFEKYTGVFSILSLFATLFLIISVIIFFLIWLIFFKNLEIKQKSNQIRTTIINTILISSIFFLIEFISIHIFQGIPWNKIAIRNALSTNLYFLQLSPIVGSLGLSIIVISVNYLFSEYLLSKNKMFLIIGTLIFLFNLVYGFLMLNFENDENKTERKVALICENVKAETKWTEEGNSIISKMLKLVKEVKPCNPELIVWSESAFPWTYIENDDILIAIAKILKGNNSQNIIGYLTQSEQDSNFVYNSAYLIDNNGSTLSRYDKSILLDFIEKPFFSSNYNNILPMLSNSHYNNILIGDRKNILTTNIGKCKIDICNESLISNYNFNLDNSFEFIVNISNDAWIEGTQNIEHHFYFARLKAIEYRKYLIINSNRGISGIVDNKGRVQVSSQTEVPEKLIGYIVPNKGRTLYSRFPLLVPALAFLIIIILTINKLNKKLRG